MATKWFDARLKKAQKLINDKKVRLSVGTSTIIDNRNDYILDKIEIVGAMVNGSKDLYSTNIQKKLEVSTNGRNYEEWTISCVNETTSNKVQTHACKGNENANTVCYHCLATLMKIASVKNKAFLLTDTPKELAGIEGVIVKVSNRQNGNIFWGIITDVLLITKEELTLSLGKKQ